MNSPYTTAETAEIDLLKDPAVARLLNVSLRTLDRWDHDKASGFPQPIRLGRYKFRRRAEVESWLRRREADSAAPTKPQRATSPTKRKPAVAAKTRSAVR